MLSELLLQRLSEFGAPTPDEVSLIDRGAGPETRYARQSIIRDQGVSPDGVYLLLDGWACSATTLRSGERQIIKIYLPGDLMGVSSLCLTETADTLSALSPALVRKLPTTEFAGLFGSSPEFAVRMFLGSQWDQVGLMDRLTALGAKPATGRLASLLLDLHGRLGKIGLVRDAEFQLRLTQDEIGDYLGLTAVHVNRTFRNLEEAGLIARRLQRIKLLDLSGLQDASGFVTRKLDNHCARVFVDEVRRPG